MLSPTDISTITKLKAQAELQRDSATAMIKMCDKILNGRGKKVDHQLARALANVYAEPKPMKQRA